MTIQKIDIVRFLELSENTPIADVRSPSEFNSGHIPGHSIFLSLMIKREKQLGLNIKRRVGFRQYLKGLNIQVLHSR